MSMKKIIASVAAAALTVGSLAVVASAEDDVRVFNFVGKEGSMTINYTATKSFLGGVDKYDLFKNDSGIASADGESVTYRFFYNISAADKDGYKPSGSKLVSLNEYLGRVHLSDWWDTKITITGLNERGNTVTASTSNSQRDWSVGGSCENFRVRLGDDGNPSLADYDLDLTRFDAVTKITISTTLPVNTQELYVASGAVKVNVALRSYDANAADMYGNAYSSPFVIGNSSFDAEANFTSASNDNDGRVLDAGYIWTFEGNYKEEQRNIGGYATGAGASGYGVGGNLLRWVNDNIVQQKGAKLRITFMQPKELQDAITSGGITAYPTLPDVDKGSTILTPGQSGTTTAQDITIGVNLRNTTKLQQTTNVVDYVAEFDWDTLVQNSASTVSGNVDSIAFRVNVNSDNLWGRNGGKNKIFATDTKGEVCWGIAGNTIFGIKSVEIVIPEQADTANDPARIITAGSADTFVKLIGTEKTIYGNGATEVAVENNITNNNVSYSLKLTDANGAYVQPAGEVTLQLSIPTDFRGLTLSSDKVRHTCNDGTVEELAIQNMETYKTDNYIVVKTSKFSSFDFSFEGAETTTEAPETTTEAPETTTEAPETTTEAAPTTDAGNTNNSGAASDKNANTGVVLAVVPAAVAAAGVIISKKRK